MIDGCVLHQHLDAVLRAREHCLSENPTPGSAQKMLKMSLGFLRILMTDELLDKAMMRGGDGEGLLLFAHRVQILQPLLKNNWPNDFTFEEMIGELYAVAHGDAPRIFQGKGKQGKFRNSHALVTLKLDAHLWCKVLGELGVKATVRQSIFIDHFGVTMEAFQKWRKEAKDKLTPDYVNRYLVSGLGSALSMAAFQKEPIAWAMEQIAAAGISYQKELNQHR